MSHVLQSGDQVEILTSKTQNVKHEWLTMVTTAKAKSKINGILRREDRAARKEGEALITAFAEKEELQLEVHNIARLCRLHNFSEYDQLLMAMLALAGANYYLWDGTQQGPTV